MKFGLQKVSIWVNIQKKFQVPQSHTIGEKYDANFKISLHFSRKVCDRGSWNLVCKEYPYGLIYKKNFKFLGRTVSEKNAMLSCKISKLFKLASHFSPILFDRWTWNFFCILTHMYTLCKPNFMYLSRTLFEKNAMITCKNSKLHNYCPNKQLCKNSKLHNCRNKQLWNFTS